MKASIKAISYYLPEKIFSNDDYFQFFPEAFINKENLLKIGVNRRHIIDPNETASDIGVKAARSLFVEHDISPEEIDFLIFCSLEFDYIFPGTSVMIHKQLDLSTSCGTLDMAVGCSGYPYALSYAKGLIESSGFKNVLLINSSSLSKLIHPKDKASRYLFGDAAAATLVSSSEGNNGIGDFVFGTESKKFDQIIINDGAARNRFTDKSFIDFTDDNGNITNNAHVYMNGYSVFNFGLNIVPQMINNLLQKNGIVKEDIDIFVFHQANLFLIETIRKKMQIPEENVFNFIENVGNTVSASIPIAIYEAQKSGKIKTGSKVVLAAFGVGLSWGATIIDF